MHRIDTTGLWTFWVPQNVFSAQPGGGTISLRKLYVLYVAQADEPALWKCLSSEWADGHCIWGFILVYFVFWLWLILFHADFERAQWTSMLALLSPIYEWLPTLNHPRVRFRYWGIIMVEAEWLKHVKPVSTTYQVLPFFRSIFDSILGCLTQRQSESPGTWSDTLEAVSSDTCELCPAGRFSVPCQQCWKGVCNGRCFYRI